MKHLFLILFASLLLIGCKKPETPLAEIDKLPPASHTGANKAGCLVNGIAFLPKGYSPGGSNLQVYYDGQTFTLGFSEKVNYNLKSVGITSYYTALHNNIGVALPLTEYADDSRYGRFIIYNSNGQDIDFLTNSINIGELKITYHNYDQAIISGTFWFDAVNDAGEKVEIREGRFDMQY